MSFATFTKMFTCSLRRGNRVSFVVWIACSSVQVSSPGSSIWTSTSDWFRPVPPDLTHQNVLHVPGNIIFAVPAASRAAAITLLGRHDIIPLSKDQCRDLACPVDPNPSLLKQIAAEKEKLDFFLKHPVDLARLPHHLDEKQIHEITDQHSKNIRELQAEIVRLEKKIGVLSPFLVKAVALNEATGGFEGSLVGNTLVMVHGCLGDRPVPMKNVPVVAFLERAPQRVYHSLLMAE